MFRGAGYKYNACILDNIIWLIDFSNNYDL